VPSRLNPYIGFSGDARTAMDFYRDVFGGELTVSTFGDAGMPGMDPEQVMHAMLVNEQGFTLMGADSPAGQSSDGGRITISLSGEDEPELRGYWDKLADGGTVTMPLEKQVWGDLFGMCTDRFGIAWMVDVVGAGD
jgi:PhnB protein